MAHWNLRPPTTWEIDEDGRLVLLKIPVQYNPNYRRPFLDLGRGLGPEFRPFSTRASLESSFASDIRQACITSLPREVHYLIIDHLPPVERVCLALTCRALCLSILTSPPLTSSTWQRFLSQPDGRNSLLCRSPSNVTVHYLSPYRGSSVPERFTLLQRLAHGWIPKDKLRYCWKCHRISSRDPEYWKPRLTKKRKAIHYNEKTCCTKEEWSRMGRRKRIDWLIKIWCEAPWEDSSLQSCDSCSEKHFGTQGNQCRVGIKTISDRGRSSCVPGLSTSTEVTFTSGCVSAGAQPLTVPSPAYFPSDCQIMGRTAAKVGEEQAPASPSKSHASSDAARRIMPLLSCNLIKGASTSSRSPKSTKLSWPKMLSKFRSESSSGVDSSPLVKEYDEKTDDPRAFNPTLYYPATIPPMHPIKCPVCLSQELTYTFNSQHRGRPTNAQLVQTYIKNPSRLLWHVIQGIFWGILSMIVGAIMLLYRCCEWVVLQPVKAVRTVQSSLSHFVERLRSRPHSNNGGPAQQATASSSTAAAAAAVVTTSNTTTSLTRSKWKSLVYPLFEWWENWKFKRNNNDDNNNNNSSASHHGNSRIGGRSWCC